MQQEIYDNMYELVGVLGRLAHVHYFYWGPRRSQVTLGYEALEGNDEDLSQELLERLYQEILPDAKVSIRRPRPSVGVVRGRGAKVVVKSAHLKDALGVWNFQRNWPKLAARTLPVPDQVKGDLSSGIRPRRPRGAARPQQVSSSPSRQESSSSFKIGGNAFIQPYPDDPMPAPPRASMDDAQIVAVLKSISAWKSRHKDWREQVKRLNPWFSIPGL